MLIPESDERQDFQQPSLPVKHRKDIFFRLRNFPETDIALGKNIRHCFYFRAGPKKFTAR
jgi:hypothetical protein